MRNLKVVGEAVKSIPHQIKKRAPEIEWKNIAGMRDILAHGDFGIDNDILWDVVAHRLPALLAAIEDLIESKDD